MNANLYALFAAHVADPAAPCVVVRAGRPFRTRTSTRHPGATRMRWSARLPARDRVAVQVDKHGRCCRSTSRASAHARLPAAQYRLPEGRARVLLRDATPRVIVCRPDTLGVTAALARNATVLTLDAHGGELADRRRREPDAFETGWCGPTSSRDPLYLGHDRTREGRDDHHRNLASNALALVQSWGFTRGECCCTRCRSTTCTGCSWRSTACESGSRMHWLRGSSEGSRRAAAACDRDDGRADVLHTAPRRAVVHARGVRLRAPVRLRLGAAPA